MDAFHFISFTDIRMYKEFNEDFMGIKWLFMYPYLLEAQVVARLLMFSHMNLMYPTIADPISVPTQDMLIELFENLI